MWGRAGASRRAYCKGIGLESLNAGFHRVERNNRSSKRRVHAGARDCKKTEKAMRMVPRTHDNMTGNNEPAANIKAVIQAAAAAAAGSGMWWS